MFKLKNRRFRPAILPGIATLPAVALTASLGNWQTRRVAEKLAPAQTLEDGAQRTVQALPATPVDARDFEFRRVSVRGEYAAKHAFLLDNKVLRGTVGYQVLTPLKMAGDEMHLLVNGGWVAAGPRRDSPPQIQTPACVQTLEGIALVPGSPLRAEFPVSGNLRDHIFLIDPLGNLMLRFPRDADQNEMRKDLARLLRVSRIG